MSFRSSMALLYFLLFTREGFSFFSVFAFFNASRFSWVAAVSQGMRFLILGLRGMCSFEANSCAWTKLSYFRLGVGDNSRF